MKGVLLDSPADITKHLGGGGGGHLGIGGGAAPSSGHLAGLALQVSALVVLALVIVLCARWLIRSTRRSRHERPS